MQSKGIIGKLHAKIWDLYQNIRKLSAFKPSQDIRTDIVAYRGAIFNQKGCYASLDQRKAVCKK